MDVVRMVVLSGSFGILAAAHVALVVGLFRRPPRWRAVLVLFVPPLGPFWGWEENLRVASAVWIVALLVYGLAFMSAVV